MESEPLALSIKDAAKRAGVPYSFLYQRVVTGELYSFTLGRKVMVKPEDLKAWIDHHYETNGRGRKP